MLHKHVPWQQRTARNGSDQITLGKDDDVELIIVGLLADNLAQGIVPQYSGSRRSVRLRFSQWLPGQPIKNLEHDQDYMMMMVSMT